jgi:hypothetical protein
MKRILSWMLTIGALFLLWSCVQGTEGASWADLEGGSEAGNPPAGDRPVIPPPDSNPDGGRNDDLCDEEGPESSDCPFQEKKAGKTKPIPLNEEVIDMMDRIELNEPARAVNPEILDDLREKDELEISPEALDKLRNIHEIEISPEVLDELRDSQDEE